MAINNKDKKQLSLIEQIAQKNPSNLVIKKPADFGAAELHNTGVTPVAPEDFEGSSQAVYTHNDSQASVKDQMNANSKLWWEAKAAGDTDWMKSLEAANQQLAGLLGDGVTYNPSSGTWSGVSDLPATQRAAMNTGVTPVLPTYDSGAWETANPRPGFNYADYQAANPAPAYDLDKWTAENPAPTYQSAYNAQIDQLMNQLMNREKFSYDAESDPLFQQYKNIYTREGNRSMNDTLAAAASGAGGMSSYAMTAAQQANNYYMAQLGDKIPELQQLAYEMYMNDLSLQRQDISMLMDKDSQDYGKFRDSMSDWYNNRDFSYGQYRDQMSDWYDNRDFAYGQYRDSVSDWYNDRNFNYNQYRDQMGDYQWGTEFNYGASRDAIEDERYQTEWDYAVGRDQIADQRYDQEWQYGLERDQIADQRYEQEWNYNVGRDQIADQRYQQEWDYETGQGGSRDDGTDEEEEPADDTGSSNKFWNSVNALGIGPRNASFILELADYGGIIENADGTVKWASGWNASNYKEKLKQAQEEAKGFSPFNFMP